MEEFLNYLSLLLTQFGGGPGPKENNLVRYGLPAVLWAVLLVVAWSRQRQQELPREKLLVWGFGLGLARELFMFGHVSSQLWTGMERDSHLFFAEPLEHALTMAAIAVVAGAFLRYVLDDARLTRRYLQITLGTTVVCFLLTWWWWHGYATQNPGSKFNQTWVGLISFLMVAVFAIIAIVLMSRKRGWLSNVVSLALGLFILVGVLRVLNFATGRDYDYLLCPICNILHILAIPLLGYVYIREQSIEKQQAEEALAAYRDQLEVLVQQRTTALTRTNEQLQQEIAERIQAEAELAQRNTELAARNAIAATISQSLDLDTILSTVMDTVLAVLEMDAGCLYLFDPENESLTLQMRRGDMEFDPLVEAGEQPCSCSGAARQAVIEMEPVVISVGTYSPECRSHFVTGQRLQTLISTPLVAKGRPVGAMALGTRSLEAISPHKLELLTGVEQQIGMAIENAHLYQETEHWAKELTLLHQMSVFLNSSLDPTEIYEQVAEQSAKLLGCQMCILFRWDEEQQEATCVTSYGHNGVQVDGLRLQLDESPILPELSTQRRSIPIQDAASDIQALPLWQERFGARGLLCVPVWGAEKPLAFLFLIDKDRPRRWRSGEIELVESFVNRAAVALENAYLHKQLEWAAALEERQRIAAEMHDGLAQTLSYLNLKTFRTTELLEEGHVQKALQECNDVQDAIDRATKEVRRSIASLQGSPSPRRSLREWLVDTISNLKRNVGPPIELISKLEEPVFLPQGHTEQIVSVVKEALLNASHHAQASQITVYLEQTEDRFVIVVEDDGQGFDPNEPRSNRGDHFGLSIMRARAARIGGRFEIYSKTGQGTKVTLTWPIEDSETWQQSNRFRSISEHPPEGVTA